MTTPTVSIVYITHRSNPRFDWFADSLAAQLEDDDLVEVIVVDGHHSLERAQLLEAIVDDRFAMLHVPPKPTPYNGPHRVTRREYSAASSARNTGIVYASAPYIVFTDDSGVLIDGWWKEVSIAATLGYVIAGTYENRADLQVHEGRIVQSQRAREARPPSVRDSRWEIGDDHALVQITGSQLFGCGLGAPRALLTAVNGFDELCDPVGGEDTQLGVRLAWRGERLFFSRRMMMVKDAHRHSGDAVTRLDRGRGEDGPLPRDLYMRRLREFGVERRTIADGAWDCGHLCLDILYGTRSTRSLGNRYDLEDLTPADLERLPDAFPERYWATGELLAQL